MIQEVGKHYLYRHVRLDKNEPFHIGIGTKFKGNSHNVLYARAYAKTRRNNIWDKIVAKTEYKVEILMESDNYDFIKEKEKEFVKLYGRIDLKTGVLSNLTDGGEGIIGYKHSPEVLQKILETKKKNPQIMTEEKLAFLRKIGGGNTWSPERRESMKEVFKELQLKYLEIGHPTAKEVYQYDIEGNFIKKWKSCIDVERGLGVKSGSINSAIKSKSKITNGYFWSRVYLGEFYDIPSLEVGRAYSKLLQLNIDGDILNTYDSMLEASKILIENTHYKNNRSIVNKISKSCKTGKLFLGCKWKILI